MGTFINVAFTTCAPFCLAASSADSLWHDRATLAW
jgi:hypothetical protein